MAAPDETEITSPNDKRTRVIAILAAFGVGAGLLVWNSAVRAPSGTAAPSALGSAAAVDREAAEMAAGLLAEPRDPQAAIARFRTVLELNPTHYGAHFQLARALDRVGKQSEATPVWEKVAQMAGAIGDKPVVDQARSRLGVSAVNEEQQMKAGLAALHEKRDAAGAIAQFRAVLARNPEHYGALFQLATALDLANEPALARPVWESVSRLADRFNDGKSGEQARKRLAEIDALAARAPAGDPEAMMKAGLESLHTKRDPVAAVAQFKAILASNPDHYGATFQLATALDAAQRPVEARPYWENVLKLSARFEDGKTGDAARARLAARP